MPICGSIIDVPKPPMQPSMPQPRAAMKASSRPGTTPGPRAPVRPVKPIMPLAKTQIRMPRITRGPMGCLKRKRERMAPIAGQSAAMGVTMGPAMESAIT